MLKLTHIGYTVIGIICLNHIGPLHIQIKNSPSALSRTILDPNVLNSALYWLGFAARVHS